MKKKILSYLLFGSIVLCNSSLAFADTVTTTGEHEVSVEGEIISTFEVVLPTSVTLQSGQSSVDFDVTVTSNTSIGEEEILSVIPEEVIYLTKNETDEKVQVLIYQDKTKFYGTEVGSEDVTTTCTIETGRLSSGVYDGALKFNISLGGDNAIIVDGVVRTWNWLLYNNYFTISDGVLSKGTADLSTLSGTLNLSNKVKTIDTKAFEGSNIDTVVLGPSVETINDAAFMSADNLTSIVVTKGNQKFSSINGILFSADGTKLLAYPAGNPATDYKITSNVTEIGDYAFAYCTNIASLTIPSTVVKTGKHAFMDMCVVSSKYINDITRHYDGNTMNPELLSTETGSILLAKKVNGYATIFEATMDSARFGANNDNHFAHYYGATNQIYRNAEFNRIISSGQSEYRNSGTVIFKTAFLATLSKEYEYVTSLDSNTIPLDTYKGITTYSDSVLTKVYSSNSKHFHLNYVSTFLNSTNHSSYCLQDITSASNINNYNKIVCADVVFSDVDIYDADNNLIYKADITK